MRTWTIGLVVIGLLAAPSLGVINIKLTADDPDLSVGESTVIRIWAQGTNAGIYSLAGDVVANLADPILLTSIAGSGGFTSLFSPSGLFMPKPGGPGPNGGWINWGTQQTNWDAPDANLGKNDFAEVFHYTIVASAPGPGDVHLMPVPHSVGGYKPLEVDKTAVLGLLTGVTIHVPEPVTVAFLAAAGLVVTCRRQA